MSRIEGSVRSDLADSDFLVIGLPSSTSIRTASWDERLLRATVRLDLHDSVLAEEPDAVVDLTDVATEALSNVETGTHPIVIPIDGEL